MERGKNITFYASGDRTEKLMEYAKKKGLPMNAVMKEVTDYFIEHKLEGKKNGR